MGKVDAEYFSYVFPILRYHNRWRELGRLDYTYFSVDKTNYTKGYLETQAVAESGVHLNEYDFEGAAWIPEVNISYHREAILHVLMRNGSARLNCYEYLFRLF